MPSGHDATLQEKVDAYLKDALAEKDHQLRAKLLGKAVYWNEMSAKSLTSAPQTVSLDTLRMRF